MKITRYVVSLCAALLCAVLVSACGKKCEVGSTDPACQLTTGGQLQRDPYQYQQQYDPYAGYDQSGYYDPYSQQGGYYDPYQQQQQYGSQYGSQYPYGY